MACWWCCLMMRRWERSAPRSRQRCALPASQSASQHNIVVACAAGAASEGSGDRWACRLHVQLWLYPHVRSPPAALLAALQGAIYGAAKKEEKKAKKDSKKKKSKQPDTDSLFAALAGGGDDDDEGGEEQQQEEEEAPAAKPKSSKKDKKSKKTGGDDVSSAFAGACAGPLAPQCRCCGCRCRRLPAHAVLPPEPGMPALPRSPCCSPERGG